MNKYISIILFTSALLFAGSCTREQDFELDRQGVYDPIVRFGLETDYEAPSPQTKTAYSGETVLVGNNRWERINWVFGENPGEEADKIRVLSDRGVRKGRGTDADPSDKNSADYSVVRNTLSNIQKVHTSEADARPLVTGNELYWEGSDNDHYFFAAYPSPDYVNDPVTRPMTFSLSSDGKSAVIGGTVPQEQSYVGKGSGSAPTVTVLPGKTGGSFEYKPVMTDAYMYAASKVAGKDVGVKKVPLRFRPLFTAFQFVIFSGDDIDNTDGAQKFKVKRVELVSEKPSDKSGTNLSGDFVVKVNPSTSTGLTGDFELLSSTGTKRSIYVDIPESERRALGKDTLKITLLALPINQTYLTLRVTFVDGAGDERVRELHLQNSANQYTDTDKGWFTLPATRKLYVKSGIPDIEYVFQVTQRKQDIFGTNGEVKENFYSVRSYRKRWDRKENKEVTEPWPWKAVGYNSDGNWVTSRPEFIALGDGNGEKGDGLAPDPGSTDEDLKKGDKLFNASFQASAPANIWYDSEEDLGNAEVSGAINLGNYNWETGQAYPGYDLRSSDFEPYETANCYIISGAGWYKIPVVYGNAYQGGVLNVGAYNSAATSNDGILQGRFLRASGQGATDARINNGPWITRATPGGAGLGHFRYPHLVWQDVKDMIKVPTEAEGQSIRDDDAAGYKPHYLYFRVNKEALNNLAGGNAVIAVCNSAGVPVWSWHIWVLPKNTIKTQDVFYWKDPARMLNATEAQTGRMTDLGSNEMMNINLGYVSTKPSRFCMVKFQQQTSGKQGTLNLLQAGDPETTSAVYYQWGRKDPMMSIGMPKDVDDGYGGVVTSFGKPIYLEDGTVINSDLDRNNYTYWFSEYDSNIGCSIERPMDFFACSSSEYQRIWSGLRYDNLWDNAVHEKMLNENDHVGEDHDYTVKTIYDPCPPGFKVPNEYAFTGFNKIAMDRQIYNTDFPAGEEPDPTFAINGIKASFYIGYTTPGDNATPLQSEGMWLYCHPTDPAKGIIFFPALGRLTGFYTYDGIDIEAGHLQNIFQEGMYWTSAPYAGPKYAGLYLARYARTFVMRRANDGSSSANIPQCIPVYTPMASPSEYSGFLRTHALQIRPIRDKFVPPLPDPSLGGITIDSGNTHRHDGTISF